jgi:hypothetical protein
MIYRDEINQIKSNTADVKCYTIDRVQRNIGIMNEQVLQTFRWLTVLIEKCSWVIMYLTLYLKHIDMVSRDVILWNVVDRYQCSGGIYCLYFSITWTWWHQIPFKHQQLSTGLQNTISNTTVISTRAATKTSNLKCGFHSCPGFFIVSLSSSRWILKQT